VQDMITVEPECEAFRGMMKFAKAKVYGERVMKSKLINTAEARGSNADDKSAFWILYKIVLKEVACCFDILFY
jgi:hypothetical protein